jgi:hypothetical protein
LGFSFGLAASQGSTRSIVSEAPSLTVLNGGSAWMGQGLLRPFVTGIVPVVGALRTSPLIEKMGRLAELSRRRPSGAVSSGEMAAHKPLHRRQQPVRTPSAAKGSTAQRGDVSVAEIRARQAAEAETARREVQSLVARGERLERLGKANVARIYYQQAASRATGTLQRRLQEKAESMRSLRDAPASSP